MTPYSQYEPVIGLEVHVQLKTESKLFCADSTAFGETPNSQTCPISLAHPGTLPVLNSKVVELAVKLGIALECDITNRSYFARKNYFYPDLPKGYQISQHTAPICTGGRVRFILDGNEESITLNRIHIEEDAGKSIHPDAGDSLIDLNRAGVPLIEIVTEPIIQSAEQAAAFLTSLRKTVRWLDVGDGNMEEGSMRCDVNISVRKKEDEMLGKRVEVKNLNSIRHVKKVIEIEFERMAELLEKKETIVQETRGFDAESLHTFSLRSKENEDDYRYFPDPDLPPLILGEPYLSDIRNKMPELPEKSKQQLMQNFGLSEYDAGQICSDRTEYDYFYELISHTKHYKATVNWMIGPLRAYCSENKLLLQQLPLSAKKISELIDLTETGKISFNNASGKVMMTLMKNPEYGVTEMAAQMNLIQDSDEAAIVQWIDEAIASMPEKVKEYQSGKKALLGLFAGAVKKISKGKADMQLVNALLLKKLSDN